MIQTGGIDMDLQALFRGFGTTVPSRDVVDITLDSRKAVRDGLFIACQGGQHHGLDFVGDALRAGVGAVAWEPAEGRHAPALPPGTAGFAVPGLRGQLGEVASRFFGRPSESLSVTGITGTNGKTTTAWLVMQAMQHLGAIAGYLGTLGHGLAGRVVSGDLTTPDCITLHRHLRQLRDAGASHVVAEVSSHALDQDRVAGVRFATVAFTNLTRDHLDYHGDLVAYGAAKARLFATGAETAVVNLDDPFGRQLAASLPAGTRLIGVTLAGAASAGMAGTVALQPGGLVIELESGGSRATLRSPLWGRFNAENLMVAAGILVASGWSLEQAATALGACTAPPGRLERVAGTDEGPAVLVDFAHTPDALAKALVALREHCTGKVWCVFGCGGDRDRGKRAPMGAAAVAGADRVIVTSDNPRSEDPAAIIADVLVGISRRERVEVEADRAAAIALAIRSAAPGDAVLVAGKGHESVQIVGGERRPFSDVAAAQAALLAVAGEDAKS